MGVSAGSGAGGGGGGGGGAGLVNWFLIARCQMIYNHHLSECI